MNHLLYFIQAEDTDLFKIGITSNSVESRLSQLRTGSPFPLSVYATVAFPTREEAETMEKLLHAALRRWNTSGEWFLIGEAVAFNTYWRVRMEQECIAAGEVARSAAGLPVSFIVHHLSKGPYWHAYFDADRAPECAGESLAAFSHFRASIEGNAVDIEPYVPVDPNLAVGDLLRRWFTFASRRVSKMIWDEFHPATPGSDLDWDVELFAAHQAPFHASSRPF